jgi:hypothetical protein
MSKTKTREHGRETDRVGRNEVDIKDEGLMFRRPPGANA